jgi:cytochrome c553
VGHRGRRSDWVVCSQRVPDFLNSNYNYCPWGVLALGTGAITQVKRVVLLFAIIVASAALPVSVAAQGPASIAPQTTAVSDAAVRAALNQYCVTCHNQRLKTAGLLLDRVDVRRVADSPEIFEKVLQRLRTGSMPPPTARRPDTATYGRLITWIEDGLDHAPDAGRSPGRSPLRRLNRTEYANAIRDLLSIDIDVSELLPPDDSAFGFDNIADLLGMSPVLLERYLNAAGMISALAVGDPGLGAGSETYRVRQDLSQDQHIEGLPLGTVGGTLVRHTFPLDGEYVFQAKLFRTNTDAARGLEYPHELEIALDGARVFLGVVGGDADFRALYEASTASSNAIDARLQVRVPVKAGSHTVSATFIEKSQVLDTRLLHPFIRSSADTYDFTGLPHLSTLTVVGPLNATGVSDTPSRQKIFSCHPSRPADELPCARRILAKVASVAYRQPATDDDLQLLLEFYQAGRARGNFDTGIQQALQRMIAGPKFVFRIEHDRAGVAPGVPHRISDYDLASRLSFFLWSTIPDEELLRLAKQGTLGEPAVLDAQVRRMLADPKARALVSNFADQWLQVRNLRNIVPNSAAFPDFDDNLRQAFQTEIELFFDTIVRENRSVVDLLTADFTFVNERLARHYHIPGIYGSQFRRVTLTDDTRRGLLGKGSVLMVTSHADRTSPVVRGKWILENVLGADVPPPPPDVPSLKDTPEDERPRSMREQMVEHRANPACATCHKVMDPIGFSLENFDAVGAWRAREANGGPIDASGELSDGTQINGVVTLRDALVARSDLFVTTVTQKLFTYALGRGLGYRDMPTVRAIVRGAAPDERFASLVLGIVHSAQFQMRMRPIPDEIRPAVTEAAR